MQAKNLQRQPQQLPLVPVCDGSRARARRLGFYLLGTILAILLLSLSCSPRTYSGWLGITAYTLSKAHTDAATGTHCRAPFKYVPNLRGDEGSHPSSMRVEVNGIAHGAVTVRQFSNPLATTSVVFYLSHAALSRNISVVELWDSESNEYALLVDTPEHLDSSACIRAEIVLALPLPAPGVPTLSIATDNVDVIGRGYSNSPMWCAAVQLRSKNGRVEAAWWISETTKLSSGTGAVIASHLDSPSVILESASGRIFAESQLIGGWQRPGQNWAIRTATGAVNVSNMSVDNLDAQTHSGPILFDDVIATKNTSLRTVSGNVAVNITRYYGIPTDASLNVRTATGAIDVLLPSRFIHKSVAALTTIGAVRIKVTDGDFGGTFLAKSTVGDVSVKGTNLNFVDNSLHEKKGSRGNGLAPQRVTALSSSGRVDIVFP
ncbi:hypothetical protein HDU88_003448 [Geranomyces variabilis]|nr:hypothetical protein HDU88_003448 [Geranomyces variabilis]